MRQVAKYYAILGKQTFTPLDLSPALWLDASDTSTITASSGAVSEWRDKSGNGYAAVQGTAAAQPTTAITTINGLNALSFDGGDSLSISSLDMTPGQKFTLAVVTSIVNADGFNILLEQTTNQAVGAFSLYRNNFTRTMSFSKHGSGNSTFFESTRTVIGTPRLVVGVHDGTLSTNENTAWIDNNSAGTRPINADTNANNISGTLFIGSRAGTSLYLNGRIAEIVICKTALNTTDRENLQTYLANKWGITL